MQPARSTATDERVDGLFGGEGVGVCAEWEDFTFGFVLLAVQSLGFEVVYVLVVGVGFAFGQIEVDEAERAVFRHHVHLADGGGVVSAVRQVLDEGVFLLVHGDAGAVDVAVLLRAVAPGHNRHSRGHTHRVLDVAALEAHAFRCDAVDVGRADHRVAVASHAVEAVFVGGDEEDVGAGVLWHWSLLGKGYWMLDAGYSMLESRVLNAICESESKTAIFQL